jgi:hypothetical protein
MKTRNETSGQERARWAEEGAHKEVAYLKDKLARACSISADCGHWDRAERLAKILAILLASEPN